MRPLTTNVGWGLANVGWGLTNVGWGLTNVGWGLANVGWGLANVGWGLTNVGWGLTNVGWGLTNVGWGLTNVGWGLIHYMCLQETLNIVKFQAEGEIYYKKKNIINTRIVINISKKSCIRIGENVNLAKFKELHERSVINHNRSHMNENGHCQETFILLIFPSNTLQRFLIRI
jgi:hypothetical protein